MKHIKYCSKCKVYSMQDTCPKCSGETVLPKPPKFSLNDNTLRTEEKVKRKNWKKKDYYNLSNITLTRLTRFSTGLTGLCNVTKPFLSFLHNLVFNF